MARGCRVRVFVGEVTLTTVIKPGSVEENAEEAKELVKDVTDAGWEVSDGRWLAQGGRRLWKTLHGDFWWKGPDTIERV